LFQGTEFITAGKIQKSVFEPKKKSSGCGKYSVVTQRAQVHGGTKLPTRKSKNLKKKKKVKEKFSMGNRPVSALLTRGGQRMELLLGEVTSAEDTSSGRVVV